MKFGEHLDCIGSELADGIIASRGGASEGNQDSSLPMARPRGSLAASFRRRVTTRRC
jgi:hypothetical protein